MNNVLKKIKIGSIALAALLILCFGATILPALAVDPSPTVEKDYYVCFSNQNYSIRNSNKMKKEGGEYILENISLRSTIDFYITDNEGVKYYDKYGDPVSVEETAQLSYNIKFNPVGLYSEELDGYKATGSHITYAFYIPSSYSLDYNGSPLALTYNPYRTNYEEYYISSIRLNAPGELKYESESVTIDNDGTYRILFTPGKTEGGNLYLFNESGAYGSGDGFDRHFIVEDAAEYYVSFVEETIALSGEDEIINGEKAYLFSRDESVITLPTYESTEFFAPKSAHVVKYRIYEKRLDGSFRLIDDDSNEDTTFSSITIQECGWYELRLSIAASQGAVSYSFGEKDFGGWYLAGDVNGWGYNERGELDIDSKYLLEEIEEADEDYNEDYDQYRIIFEVTKGNIKDGKTEFVITDGSSRFMNLASHISIDEAGKYELLFSPFHNYGRGRYYRYSLIEDEDPSGEEVTISSAEEFNNLARRCNEDAGVSSGMKVYIKNDIDFSSVSIVPIKTFSGKLYGGFHTMKNIRITSSSSVKSVIGTLTTKGAVERLSAQLTIDCPDDEYVGFIGRNYGKVLLVSTSGKITGRRYVGGVAGYNGRVAESSGATQNFFIDGELDQCSAISLTLSGATNAGLIAGFNDGKILGCSASDTSVISGKSNNANTSPVNIGGIVGYSSGRISECEASCTINGASSVNVGGVAGLCNGEIYFSKYTGNIEATQYAGGIAGYYGTVERSNEDILRFFSGFSYEDFIAYFSEDSGEYEQTEGRANIITYCVFDGNVTSKSYAGGIVGFSSNAFEIRNCISSGNVEANAGSYAGGIIGQGQGASIYSCQSEARVKCSGLGGGNYAGGIAGSVNSVYYSTASSFISGNNYIGGIAGEASGYIIGCYSNVLLSAGTSATSAGDIAGSSTRYNASTGKFDDYVKYNFYLGSYGGIGGISFGSEVDYAAFRVTADEFMGEGTLPASLPKGFSSSYWLAGENEPRLPSVRSLEICDVSSDYGDDEEFESIFAAKAAEYAKAADDYSKPSYLIIFKEWDSALGDLLDNSGKINEASFKETIVLRLSASELENLSVNPTLSELNEKTGRYIYEGSTEDYFVEFKCDPSVATSGTTVYASYSEVVRTLETSAGEATVLVEGLFDKGSTASLISGQREGDWTISVSYNGNAVSLDEVTIRWQMEKDADKALVRAYSRIGEKYPIESEISGDYVVFTLKGDMDFSITFKKNDVISEEIPIWVVVAASASGAAVIVCGAFVIAIAIARARHKRT